MKPIKLSEKQKDNLLEMVRKLFPEYNWSNCLYGGDKFVHFTQGNLEYELLTGPIDEEIEIYPVDESIHWFEFCYTFLVEKIFNPDNPDTSKVPRNLQKKLLEFFEKTNYYFWNINFGDQDKYYDNHPIEYLYSEFKKLNL